MKTKFLLALAFAGALTQAAHAGSNECSGEIKVGPEWTTVADFNDRLCKFKTNSKLGQRILKTCPNGSECTIHIPLDGPYSELKNGEILRIDSAQNHKEFSK